MSRLQSDDDPLYVLCGVGGGGGGESQVLVWRAAPVFSGEVMAMKPTWCSPNPQYSLAALADAFLLAHPGFPLSAAAWEAEKVMKGPCFSFLRTLILPLYGRKHSLGPL